jgi:uncharacterized protein YjbI with pentapeptide repeats
MVMFSRERREMKQRTSRAPRNEQIKAPLLSKKREDTHTNGEIEEHARFSGVLLNGIDLQGQVAYHPWFEDVLMTNVVMTGTQFEALVADDVRFEHCTLVGVNWRKAGFHRV